MRNFIGKMRKDQNRESVKKMKAEMQKQKGLKRKESEDCILF